MKENKRILGIDIGTVNSSISELLKATALDNYSKP